MSDKRDRVFGLGQGKAVSLVAMISCALASDAFAGSPSAEPIGSRRELSDRVQRIVERIQLTEPALKRELPATAKFAQWRNR